MLRGLSLPNRLTPDIVRRQYRAAHFLSMVLLFEHMGVTPSPAVVRASELLYEMARQPNQCFTVSELARKLGPAASHLRHGAAGP